MAKKGKKKPKEIDWTADANFDKNRSIIYIEHSLECPIFTMKADEFLKFLTQEIPDRQFVLIKNNNGKTEPRPGAFEIDFSQNARTSKHNLWSGIENGPPRRDKFPVFSDILPEVQKVLRKFYPEPIPVEEEDEEVDPQTDAVG